MNKIALGFNADLTVAEIVRYSLAAEKLGFDSVWLHEHSFARDALSYLSAAAHSTSHLRLGVGCISPYTRHPVVLAMSMFTLQESSRGQAILGLGTGFPMRLDLMGIRHEKPIGALKEAIEICRRIWSGETVEYSGNTFSIKNVKSISGRPLARIPIYIAGWKKQMLALTGKCADGYIAKGGESPESLSRIVSEIRRSALKHSRSLQDFEVTAYLLTFAAREKSEALSKARRDPFVNYMLSVQDEYLYEESGIDPDKKRAVAENYFRGRLDESSKNITDEMLEAFTLCGNPEEIRGRVQDYRKGGLDLPILQPTSTKNEDILAVMEAGSMLISSEMDKPIVS